MARPSKYKADFAEQARKLCKLGATDQELADFFEVAISTLNLWKIQHPEFSESLKLGKEVADERVANALYQRAMGYSHPDVDIRVVDGAIVETPLIKHYAPDTTAAIFWLKNRRPDEWRDRQEVAHDVTGSLAERMAKARERQKQE
ncbi:terminase [Stutzerimonas balearica]|uniref:terminase n=1 Tax=Stutzerimonas balearica TaxID=74829 RepID=UPI000970CFA4|nr:terminase [Stutzerimonas balearica]OMG61475.1 terminase [Stutzerimonas balearica]